MQTETRNGVGIDDDYTFRFYGLIHSVLKSSLYNYCGRQISTMAAEPLPATQSSDVQLGKAVEKSTPKRLGLSTR